eukprot:1158827-Pelagomonas_calceolata.AAC.5
MRQEMKVMHGVLAVRNPYKKVEDQLQHAAKKGICQCRMKRWMHGVLSCESFISETEHQLQHAERVQLHILETRAAHDCDRHKRANRNLINLTTETNWGSETKREKAFTMIPWNTVCWPKSGKTLYMREDVLPWYHGKRDYTLSTPEFIKYMVLVVTFKPPAPA